MGDAGTKRLILNACGLLLEPLIRLLLKSGITWKEFADLAKTKYVQVATEDFGIKGRPTNASRVAILTGLDRREVRRLRELARDADANDRHYTSKATQVLSGWFHDADFLGPEGKPRDLPIEGDSGSFTSLVRRYAPALPPVAMIKELRSAGAIEELGDGQLRALKREYIPQPLDESKIRLFGSIVHDLGTTLEHNLTRPARAAPRFERRAISVRVDPQALPAFRELLEVTGQEFLVRIDDWLTAHEVGPGMPAVRLGVGVYHIEDRRSPRLPR
jgi:hypothetical protein